jgi:hypothetical protein
MLVAGLQARFQQPAAGLLAARIGVVLLPRAVAYSPLRLLLAAASRPNWRSPPSSWRQAPAKVRPLP